MGAASSGAPRCICASESCSVASPPSLPPATPHSSMAPGTCKGKQVTSNCHVIQGLQGRACLSWHLQGQINNIKQSCHPRTSRKSISALALHVVYNIVGWGPKVHAPKHNLLVP